jgi:hypothetical protein
VYLANEFSELAKRYRGMHIWAKGYSVSTVAKTKKKKEEQARFWNDNSE